MAFRLTIFTDCSCTKIARIVELHGRDAKKFAEALKSQGEDLSIRTYRHLGVRIDDAIGI